MSKKGSRIFIGVGTNLGNKKENLTRAIAEIKKIGEVLACSPVYETEPVGFVNQQFFYNQVLEIQTRLHPQEFLHALKEIEKSMGRVPTTINGPRIIDCDILYYGNLIMKTDILTIPHPRAAERAFVLVPLCAIAPEFMDPVQEKQVHELLKDLPEERRRKVKQLYKHA